MKRNDISQLDLGDDDDLPVAPKPHPPAPVLPVAAAGAAAGVLVPSSQYQSDRMKQAVSLMRSKPADYFAATPLPLTQAPQPPAAPPADDELPKKRQKIEETAASVVLKSRAASPSPQPSASSTAAQEEGEEEEPSLPVSDKDEGENGDGTKVIPIPGPAGTLPKSAATVQPSQMAQKPRSREADSKSRDGVVIQSKLSKSAMATGKGVSSVSAVASAAPGEAEMFTRGAWAVALRELSLVPYGTEKLGCNIEFVLTRGFLTKVSRLLVAVCAVAPTIDSNVRLTLRDPTGTMDGIAQRRALEQRPDVKVGCVLWLKKVSVFTPSPSTHLVNIVSDNIERVFPADVDPLEDASAPEPERQRAGLYVVPEPDPDAEPAKKKSKAPASAAAAASKTPSKKSPTKKAPETPSAKQSTPAPRPPQSPQKPAPSRPGSALFVRPPVTPPSHQRQAEAITSMPQKAPVLTPAKPAVVVVSQQTPPKPATAITAAPRPPPVIVAGPAAGRAAPRAIQPTVPAAHPAQPPPQPVASKLASPSSSGAGRGQTTSPKQITLPAGFSARSSRLGGAPTLRPATTIGQPSPTGQSGEAEDSESSAADLDKYLSGTS